MVTTGAPALPPVSARVRINIKKEENICLDGLLDPGLDLIGEPVHREA
jgi:hypothetical protein